MRLDMGLVLTANVEVTYGPLRLAVAQWAGIDPADVTPDHVARYEIACDEEGRQP